MTRIGITGHQDLPDIAIEFVVHGIREVLVAHEDVTGYSSLAVGADQIFATEVVDAGGRLHAVIPCVGYRATFGGLDLKKYETLLGAATETTELPFSAPSEAAYDAAGRWIAENVDLMVAIWDGEPARGLGGTADAVAHARELDVEVKVIWPNGIERKG